MIPHVWKVSLSALVLATGALGLHFGWAGSDGVSAQATIAATGERDTVPEPEFGMNLGRLNTWSEQFPFVDLIDGAEIKVIDANGAWKPARETIELNDLGYPTNVPAGTTVVALIKSGEGDHLPAGTYRCEVSPGWKVETRPPARISGSGTTFDLLVGDKPSRSTLHLRLKAQQPRTDLSALSCRDRTAAPDQIFRTAFLDDIRPFKVIRYMDWMAINDQPPQRWEGRTTPESFSQNSPNGASLEYMMALTRELGSDPWFTMPLDVEDAYYRNFASYVRDHLPDGQKVYVEVSNEVWNPIYGQTKEAMRKGMQRYPSANRKAAGEYYYADRVRAVMAIWTEVFRGQEDRLVRVLATQAGTEDRPEYALGHENTADYVDAMAISAYFGPLGRKVPPGEDAVSYLLGQSDRFIGESLERGRTSKAVADRWELPLITYEAGPDYVAFGAADVRKQFQAVENDPRMYGIYSRFLERWATEVGGLYMAYNATYYSYFGHKRYTGQPLEEAHKMRALLDFMRHGSAKDTTDTKPAASAQ
jgi:hypothetical protein